MIDSSLCYLIRGDEVLMMHRTRKKNDINHDKWIAVGGRFEAGETPEECALREVREETGLTMTDPQSGYRNLYQRSVRDGADAPVYLGSF